MSWQSEVGMGRGGRMHEQLTFSLVLLAILLAPVPAAMAGVTYSDGGTHDVTTVLAPGKVTVSNHTTLNVQPGGSITGGTESSAYGISVQNSTVNVNGGSVVGGIGTWTEAIYGSSGTVNVYSGTVASGNGTDRAIFIDTVNVYGGTITGPVNGGYGNVAIRGGSITGYVKDNYGALDIYSGSTITGDVQAGYGATTIHGGDITGCVRGGFGPVSMYGGSVRGGGGTYNIGVETVGSTSVINIYGGSVSVDGSGSQSRSSPSKWCSSRSKTVTGVRRSSGWAKKSLQSISTPFPAPPGLQH